MATFVMKDSEILLNDLDLSGHSNQVSISLDVEMADVTVWGVGTRQSAPGLRTAAFEVQTLYDPSSGAIDKGAFDALSTEGALISVAPQDSTAGNPAYFGEFQVSSRELGGSVGELLVARVSAVSRYKPTRGIVAVPHSQLTATGTSAKYQLGAVTSTNQLVAQVHCTQFNGTSLDIAVQSDADVTAGSETTRFSMTQLTGVGAERKVYTTTQAQTWWRFSYTFVGTSFTALMLLGIEPRP